jgi:hypothetical protein
MTTPAPPSARPPSSRRFAALDSPQARAFVDGADPRPGEGASPPGPPPHTTETIVDLPRPEPVAAPLALPVVPQPARKERLQMVTLRVPETLHAQLIWIAENGSRSMNQLFLDAVRPVVETEIQKIQRRKAMGLD